MDILPVHIITGFLGAGKTTAIIQLLNRKPKAESWAIVVNEFGKVSIDGQTLISQSSAGSVFEISGGCICCSAKGYFNENLEKIIKTNSFDRIIIEPSGLGGIDHITDLVKQNGDLQLMPIICLVDILLTDNPRFRKLPIYCAQIQKADLILFSKADLIADDERTKLIGNFEVHFPGKTYRIKSATDDLSSDLTEITSASNNQPFPALYLTETERKNLCKEFSLKIPGNNQVDIQKLTSLLENEKSILRVKGYIYTEMGWHHFNYTLSGITVEKCQPKEFIELVFIYLTNAIVDFQLFKYRLNELFDSNRRVKSEE